MNTGLLLIDIQNDYFPQGRMPLFHSTEASQQAALVLQACRQKKNIPIVHVQHISTDPNATILFPCTQGAAFHKSVAPLSTETVVKKHYPNGFKDTSLSSVLQKCKVRHLVVAGMMTHMCIDATIRAAFDLGFSITLLHDACAARELEFNGDLIDAMQVHTAFVAALNYKYATVMSSQQWIERLQMGAAAVAA